MASQEQLPPGWTSEWNQEYQRPLYIETATGHTQWEPPSQGLGEFNPEEGGVPIHQQPTTHNPKRRQYAAGQTEAYYGGGPAEPQYGGGYPIPGAGGGAPAGGGQFFTPGAANDYAQPPNTQGGYYGQQPPADQGVYTGAPVPGAGGVGALADQFGAMNVGGTQPPYFGQQAGGQKPFALYTTNVLGQQPDPYALQVPPPEIRLPPGASFSQSPFINADPSYMRSTINAFPANNSLLQKSKLPLALVITPHRSVKEGEEVPLVTDQVIARCRRCRAYINPFVQFIEGGSRWKCVMCQVTNDVPQYYDWDQTTNTQADRWQRAELNHSVVEFVAPSEYMVRPPQPLVYTFLIDVSHHAVQSGMVATATRTILESLDRIPNGDDRTKVAFIGFDTALYFFTIPTDGSESTMMVVSDLDDVFLPKPSDLLVNLKEARAGVEALLGKLSDMFQNNVTVGSALGPALQAGFKLISPIGGNMVVLSASLPSLGAGALKDRDDPKLFGTAKESSLLQAASSFYKTFAIECSRSQVSVTMFLFSSHYQDIATLSCLPRYTSGQTYFYPAFTASRAEDALKFAHEFGEVLASPVGSEGLVRVRASRGLRMSQFHGNFFVRSTDLLAMSAFPTDQSYTIEVVIEEAMTTPFVVFQTGVLYTSCDGERRIRVVTLALPTTSNLSEIYSSVDQVAVATYLGNKAVERSQTAKLEDARDALTNKLVDIFSAYRSAITAGGLTAQSQVGIADNMKMLPVLTLGLLKHVALRQSSTIPSDLRAYAQALLTSLPSELIIPYIHPNFYSLHDMPPEAGTVGEHGIIMPPLLPLTSERLIRHGLFLIEDGQNMFLWIGRDAVPQLVQDVFDLPSYDHIQGGKITLPVLENDFSQRVNAVIAKTRELRRGPYWPHLYLVREDGEPALRLWALSLLVLDRADQAPSYQQFLQMLRDKLQSS